MTPKKKSLGLGTAFAGVLVVVAVAKLAAEQSATYRVERSIDVAAPPSVLLAQIADLQRWRSWSPWDGEDVHLQRRYGGPASGVGASYYWSGGERLSQGRLTVTAARAEQVELELEVQKPRHHASDLEFRLFAEGAATRVTFVMTGENDSWVRLLGLLPRPVQTIRDDMETGLAQLKRVAEALASNPTYRVERSATVVAPPGLVRARIVDLHHWAAWSPWGSRDAATRRDYGGPHSGAGSSYYWSGVDDGQGRITILTSSDSKVELEIDVAKPRPFASDMEIVLAPDGAGTRVTWTVMGDGAGDDEARRGAPGTRETEVSKLLEQGLAQLVATVEQQPSSSP